MVASSCFSVCTTLSSESTLFSAYTGIYGVQPVPRNLCSYPLTLRTALCLSQSLCVHACRFVCLFAVSLCACDVCLFACFCAFIFACLGDPDQQSRAARSCKRSFAASDSASACLRKLSSAVSFNRSVAVSRCSPTSLQGQFVPRRQHTSASLWPVTCIQSNGCSATASCFKGTICIFCSIAAEN